MRTEWKVSVRRACRVLRFDAKSYRYRSRRPGQAILEKRMKEICETRVRYGYRRGHVLLRREGWAVNVKRTRRMYNELGLQLRSKTPKRRVKAALRADRTPPSRSNEVWAMDFVHDQLATGGKLRILTEIDTFSRYVPVIDPRPEYRVQTLLPRWIACAGRWATRVPSASTRASPLVSFIGLHQREPCGPFLWRHLVEPHKPPASPLANFFRLLARPGWRLIIAFWVVVVMGLFVTRRIF